MLMSYYCYILFTPMIFITNFLILSTSSWFSMWMIMEINLINFISLILFEKKINKNISMIYFLIQSFNSYLFLMSMLMIQYNFNSMKLMLIISMINKLGIPPFYQWYIKLMNNMGWMNIFILSTIQKIIPLYILNSNLNNFWENKLIKLIMMYVIFSSIISSLKAMNSMKIKTIMSYSSIIQMCWIILIMMINEKISINYFLIYSMISLNLSMFFNNYKMMYIQDLMILKNMNPLMSMMLIFSILSLAGLPPFFGFLMKWLAIKSIQENLNFYFLTFMMMISLINTFFYLRIGMNSLIINSITMKTNFKFIKILKLMNPEMYFLNWIILISLMMFQLF